MAILGIIFEAAAFAALDFGIDSIKNGKKDPNGETKVELVIGSGAAGTRMGGKKPSIALWNEQGERLGQDKPGGKTSEGDNIEYGIDHDQGHKGAQQAAYIMLSNPDDDAICISAIYITDEKVNTVWMGDIGHRCGMSWGLSQRDIGEKHTRPKCVWLDNDGTNGINAQAMSFHIPDMVGNPDRLAQYNEKPDSLCKSTPRFSFWGDLLPDSRIPFFKPELEYEKDSENGGLGRDKDIDRVLDSKDEFDKSVSLYLGDNAKRGLPGGRDIPTGPRVNAGKKRRARSEQPSQRLVVTPYVEHSARELCKSDTSWGPDTVSLSEALFCDMDTRGLFDLCDEAAGVTTNCFDLATETLMLPQGAIPQPGVDIHARGLSVPKMYNSTSYW